MTKYCVKCGAEMQDDARFCGACGTSQEPGASINSSVFVAGTKSTLNKIVGTINENMGEDGKFEIKLRSLVSSVFKKHTKEECDEVFSYGVSNGKLTEKEMLANWSHPWLYSRVYVTLLVVSFMLYFMMIGLGNFIAVPGFITMSALVSPFAIMIFFWEINIPKNISFYEVLVMLFVGGVASLIVTLFLYQVFNAQLGSYLGAMLIGVVEELGKVIVATYFINKYDTKYILNGLLIGACVGAGFAFFESAGYTFGCIFEENTVESITYVAVLRSVLAIGGHVAWAAITGGALVAVKRTKKFETGMLTNQKFLFFFIITVVLHGLWDSPLADQYGLLLLAVLCFAAWVVLLVQINAGFKQISRLANEE